MDELRLKIEYVPIDSIKAYSRNAKLHPQEQIEQIKESIRQVGFRDPIGIWHGEVVEGHGRLLAAQELGMNEVPIIRLDDLTDEQRRFYMLVHNQTTMNSGWDFTLLEDELASFDMDMSVFGFDMEKTEDLFGYMRDDTFVDHTTDRETFDFTLQIPSEYKAAFEEYSKRNGKETIVNMVVTEVLDNA